MSEPRKEADALKAILAHLKNAVEKNEGIPLSRLEGMLSQLPSKKRGNFSASPATIRLVTHKFPGTIFVDPNNQVYSCTHSNEPPATEPSKPTSSRKEDEITELCNVYGTVQYLASSNLYGFIMVHYPVKANVFFDRKAIKGGMQNKARMSNVKVGSTVLLSAVKSLVGHKAKFQATRVIYCRGGTVAMPTNSLSSPERSSRSGDGEMIFNCTGFIHSIKFNHGFIMFGRKQQMRAFFHRDQVKKTVLKPKQKLFDVFAAKDEVRFDARRSSRCTKSVKWEATMVTKIAEHPEPSQHHDTVTVVDDDDEEEEKDDEEEDEEDDDEEEEDDDGDDEVFMSGDESEIAELLEGCERPDMVDGDASGYPVGHLGWEASSRWHPAPSNTELFIGYFAGRKLLGTAGTLYAESQTTALVFCVGLDAALAVEIGVVYQHGKQIQSFNDLLSNSSIEGAAEVFVDAVEVASDVWVAALVWTGDRPLRHYREGLPNLTLDAARLGRPGREPYSRDGVCEFSSVSEAGGSVVAHRAARGTVLKVALCSGVCAVQEPGRSRRIEFTCFYRNGTAYYRNLHQLLRQGAVVSVDYMVGVAEDGKEKVYCGLVWQGLKPPCVDQLSREEFRQWMSIIDVQPEVPSTATAVDAVQGAQFWDNAVHGGHPGTSSAIAPAVKRAASFGLPSGVTPASPSPRLLIPPRSTAPGKPWSSTWEKQRVQNASVGDKPTSRAEPSEVLAVSTVPAVPPPSRAEPSSVITVSTVLSMPTTSCVKSSPRMIVSTVPSMPTTSCIKSSPRNTDPTVPSVPTTSHAESSAGKTVSTLPFVPATSCLKSSPGMAVPTVPPVPTTSCTESSTVMTVPTTSCVESSPKVTIPMVPSVPTTGCVEPSPGITAPMAPSMSTPSCSWPSTTQTCATAPPVTAYDKVEATATAKSIDTTGDQSGEASGKPELTDEYFSVDEEMTTEKLNRQFEEDSEAMMLGCKAGCRGCEEVEQVIPSDSARSTEKELQGWAARLEAGDASGKVDIGERAGQAAARLGSNDAEVSSKLEANISERVSTGPGEETAAKEATRVSEESSQQPGCTSQTDVALWQRTSDSTEGEVEVERVSVAVADVVAENWTLTGEVFRRMIGAIVQEIKKQLQDFVRKTVLEVVQKLMPERQDAATQVDEGSSSCASRPT